MGGVLRFPASGVADRRTRHGRWCALHTLPLAAPKRKTPGPKAGIPISPEVREKQLCEIFSDFSSKSITPFTRKLLYYRNREECWCGRCHAELVAAPVWLVDLLEIFGLFGRCCSETVISDPYPSMEAGYRRSYLELSWIRRGECVAD